MIKPKVSRQLILLLILLVPVSLSLIADSLYHIGYFRKPVFLRNNIPPYHWRLNQSFEQNYLQSSLPYLSEIDKINQLTEDGAVFYTDTATSYYVAVSSKLYASNPKSNHNRNYGTAPQSLLYTLCHGGLYAKKHVTLKDYFEEKNKLNIQRGLHPIKYIIYNRDEVNRNLANCSIQQYPALTEKLEGEFKLLYRGDNLDLYSIEVDSEE